MQVVLTITGCLWVPKSSAKPKNLPKVSGCSLKYSQISEIDDGDWFDLRQRDRDGSRERSPFMRSLEYFRYYRVHF
jgi:hypothetical protein